MLNPWFITGFTDGEGCFALYVRKDTQKRKTTTSTYYRWQVDFAITLRGDDIKTLEEIRDYFGCGVVSQSIKSDSIGKHKFGQCGYHVVVPNDLANKVIPHFEKFPLQSKKKVDFEYWKKAVQIIKIAKERKKSLFDKVLYTQSENGELISVLNNLKNRLTGGHITQKRISYEMQGKKEIINSIEEKTIA